MAQDGIMTSPSLCKASRNNAQKALASMDEMVPWSQSLPSLEQLKNTCKAEVDFAKSSEPVLRNLLEDPQEAPENKELNRELGGVLQGFIGFYRGFIESNRFLSLLILLEASPFGGKMSIRSQIENIFVYNRQEKFFA